ncbi:NADP-dependent oxidoreductase domain-containing protein [Syncephalastrum racemosum]|uniref:NADP-dependent oxidoreductase domain-containing protein n=1 Tax=Syncephalastrum racemosum TaxID=13706 RepID=A0A1X2HSL2_SYNRA|nr:NADP-dependent oxidoreductase domain-containing protein [Syncephalastrum racemosum]
MTTYVAKLDNDVVPTQDTKILLAGQLPVPPIVWDWSTEAEKDAKEAFDTACKLGIAFFDTAELYGNGVSERCIGQFRKDYSPEEHANQVIATKFFPYAERTQFPDVLLSALRDSLARLGVQKGDLYQIHGPIHKASISVVGNALADAVESGLVKTVGVSNYSKEQVREMHDTLKKRGIQLASNQISYSMIHTRPETSGLIQTCHDLGVAVLAYSPLERGLLTGKFGYEGPFPEKRKDHFEGLDKAQLKNLLDTIQNLATKYGRQSSAIVLNWCICKGTIPLAGSRTAEHVKQNEAALHFRLADEEVASLDRYSFEGDVNRFWKSQGVEED